MTNRAPRLSVLIITYNEERLLAEVLKSVSWADEIIVVDSGSTDRTAEIARRYTEHFHVHPYEGQGIMRQHSFNYSTGDWILYIDADEVVTPALRTSIQTALRTPEGCNAFQFELRTKFLGVWFGSRGWRKEWKTRLFARDHGSFDARPVHEGATIQGPVGTLEGFLLHYPYRDLAHATEKMNRYSSMGAEVLRARGTRSSVTAATLRAAVRFLRDYVLGGDFLYGVAGMTRSMIMAHYTFLKYAKVAERSSGAAAQPARG